MTRTAAEIVEIINAAKTVPALGASAPGFTAAVWQKHGKTRVYVTTRHRKGATLGYFDLDRGGAFYADCANDVAAQIRALVAE